LATPAIQCKSSESFLNKLQRNKDNPSNCGKFFLSNLKVFQHNYLKINHNVSRAALAAPLAGAFLFCMVDFFYKNSCDEHHPENKVSY
jgi:hypothetical protein